MHRNGSDSTKTVFLKKNDILLITVLLILAIFCFLFFKMGQKNGSMVQVRMDDSLYGSYSLEEDQEIVLQGEDYKNILIIREGKASMTQADCPDQICVHHKSINKQGESIVCLPHKIVVEVISQEEEAEFDIITK